MYFIGFDIGASRIKAALVESKKIIKSQRADLPGDLSGLLDLMEKIFKELTEGLAFEQIGGLGIDVPGFEDAKEKLFKIRNIKYLNDQALTEVFGEKFKPYSVRVGHDVHCFLLAEKETGLAQNLKNVFFLTLGSGVGGAFMVNGQIISGAHNAAGEVGHAIFDICQTAEFEELASNKFILKNLDTGSEDGGQLARAGDPKALEIFDRLSKNLGIGIANIINIFDPEAVILAGGIAENEKLLMPGIKESIERFVESPAAKETPILFSQLGPFSGALGAALLFKN